MMFAMFGNEGFSPQWGPSDLHGNPLSGCVSVCESIEYLQDKFLWHVCLLSDAQNILETMEDSCFTNFFKTVKKKE